ncbi:MAG: alpha/beta fold hydrolase [Rhodobacterales bacterium]|nr:alpha/beta fold hydrolase [Rhodobacterales bacterium]
MSHPEIERLRLTAGGQTIGHLALGRDRTGAAPVVLIHSSAVGSGQWRDVMPLLDHPGPLHAIDLHGYGETSPWTHPGPVDHGAEAALVAALIDHLGAPAHVVGHSFGALIGLRVARDHGDRVAGLVALEPVTFGLLPDRRDDAMVAALRDGFEGALARADGGDMAGFMTHLVDYWNRPGFWDGLSDRQREKQLALAGKVHREVASAMADRTPLESWTAIAAPVRLMGARGTTAAAKAVLEILHAARPDWPLDWLPDCGHMAPLTHPATTARFLNAALKGQTTP